MHVRQASPLGARGQRVHHRLGQIGRAIHRADGKIIDNDDVVSGIVLLRKGAEAEAALEGIHAKVRELNDRILPPGVKVVPFLDRSVLVHYTTHTVLHNLTEGILLVALILILFLGNFRGAVIVAMGVLFVLAPFVPRLSREWHVGALMQRAGRADVQQGEKVALEVRDGQRGRQAVTLK